MAYLRPGDSFSSIFTTQRIDNGQATDADATPTATPYKNGTADGSTFVLTVTHLTNGIYKVTGTVPSGYAAGDTVDVLVTATVKGISGNSVIDCFDIDTKRPSDLYTPLARALGLSQDNWAMDSCTYDSGGNMTAATMWIYDTAAHATTNDHVTGLVYKWAITAAFNGSGQLTSAIQTRVI